MVTSRPTLLADLWAPTPIGSLYISICLSPVGPSNSTDPKKKWLSFFLTLPSRRVLVSPLYCITYVPKPGTWFFHSPSPLFETVHLSRLAMCLPLLGLWFSLAPWPLSQVRPLSCLWWLMSFLCFASSGPALRDGGDSTAAGGLGMSPCCEEVSSRGGKWEPLLFLLLAN